MRDNFKRILYGGSLLHEVTNSRDNLFTSLIFFSMRMIGLMLIFNETNQISCILQEAEHRYNALFIQ